MYSSVDYKLYNSMMLNGVRINTVKSRMGRYSYSTSYHVHQQYHIESLSQSITTHLLFATQGNTSLCNSGNASISLSDDDDKLFVVNVAIFFLATLTLLACE